MAEGCRVLTPWSAAGPAERNIDPEDKGNSGCCRAAGLEKR